MSKETRTTILFVIFQIVLVVAAFALGMLVDKYGYAHSELPILNEAYSILTANGLQEPPADPALEYGMIHGMVQAYGDPFTSFVEPVQAELQTNQLEGKFGGIGSTIQQGSDGYFYLVPYPDSPAALAGIQENDRLIAVDDTSILETFSTDEIAALVRGPENTRVMIVVSHPPEYTATETIAVKRQEVALPSIEYFIAQNYPSVGVLQINIIADSTPSELTSAVQELQSRGATAFVIDLRNNGGGLLESGIDLAALFLEKSDMIIQKQEKNHGVESITAGKNGELADLNIAILVNGNTASAAEIFAGALQANARCQLFGQQSYGKNTIQFVYTLQDDSSLHVTAAKWWFPALPTFQMGNGLIPDQSFNDQDSMDPATMENAIQALLAM